MSRAQAAKPPLDLEDLRHLRRDYCCHRAPCACSGDDTDCTCVARTPATNISGCVVCGASLLNISHYMADASIDGVETAEG